MYYFLFFILGYSVIISRIISNNKLFIDFLAVLMLLFFNVLVGFRYNVGTDYLTYEMWFNYWYRNITIEWIYTSLNYLVKINGGDFYHITLIMAIITNVFIFLGIKKWGLKNNDVILALFIYGSSYMFVFTNGMRQGVAVAIFLFASYYIVEKKIVKYLFFILLGAGFHISILFLLPFYFFPKNKLKYSYFVVLVFVSYVIVGTGLANYLIEVLLNLTFYSAKYSEFISGGEIFSTSSSILSPGILISIFTAIVLLLYQEKLDSKYNIVLNFYMIGKIFSIFALSTYMYNRFGIYFHIFELIACVILLRNIEGKNMRSLAYFTYILISFIIMFKLIVLDAEQGNFIYRSIFDTYIK